MTRARALIAEHKPDEARPVLSSLQEQLNATKVDKALVSQKLQRLTAELGARELPPAEAAPLYVVFETVQAAYFRGDYASANRSLNEIKAELDEFRQR